MKNYTTFSGPKLLCYHFYEIKIWEYITSRNSLKLEKHIFVLLYIFGENSI